MKFRRSILSAFSLMAVGTALLLGLSPARASGPPPVLSGSVAREGFGSVPGEVVLHARPGTPPASIRRLALNLGGRLRKRIPQRSLYLLRFPVRSAARGPSAVEPLLARLRGSRLVRLAYPNYLGEGIDVGNGRMISSALSAAAATSLDGWQWHLDRIKWRQAGPAPAAGPLVAVLDTGVDYTHPDLATRVILGHDFVDSDDDPMDEDGHGTHVAGIIAAGGVLSGGVTGISPTSRILAVRVLDSDGGLSIFQLTDALVYARGFPGVRIINMSIRFYLQAESDAWIDFKDLIDETVFIHNVVVVVGAGNDDDQDILYSFGDPEPYLPLPAWLPSCLTVAASTPEETRAGFSNYGIDSLGGTYYGFTFVDVAAPGVNILSTMGGGAVLLGGTSMASPVAAGVAARVLAADPDLSPAEVMDLLISSGRMLGAAAGFPRPTPRVDLLRALQGKIGSGFTGFVRSAQSGLPLSFARVQLLVGTAVVATATTDESGGFTLVGPAKRGPCRLSAFKHGYIPLSVTTNFGRGVVDIARPFFLAQTRDAEACTIVTTWNSLYPGDQEAAITTTSQPPWLPIGWADTAGAYFIPRLDLDGETVVGLGASMMRGSLLDPPYAMLTTHATDTGIACHTIVISQPQPGTYVYYTRLDNAEESGYNEWGDYRRSGAETRIYRGAQAAATIRAVDGTGSGPWWVIAEIAGDLITPLNYFSFDNPGTAP